MLRSTALILAVSAVAASAARPHYGDPNGLFGCLPDEVKAQITGLDGDLCIPPCDSSGACPQDKPEGASAKPACVLTSSTGAKYCALVCSAEDADAQCGAKASCKKADKDDLCTYDDMPKPPSSEHWVPIDSPSFSAQAVCLAVGFTQDGVTGFAGAGSNNVGAQVIKSTDSGKTWTATPAKQEFNIFLNTATDTATSAVVSGVIEQEHTTDGEHFIGGGPFLAPAQDIGILPSGEFALVGQTAKGNGVFLSKNGAHYKDAPIPETVLNSTFELARYGAFPTETTWYITAGAFPENNDGVNGKATAGTADGTQRRRVTHRLSVSHENYVIEQPSTSSSGRERRQNPAPVNCDVDPRNCFAAAIIKTTDGGKTWTKVYENVNTGDNIYSNGIHCASADHCISVVEGDSTRILLTRDGGKTWKETQHVADPHASLVAVRMLDENEGWVSGGEMSNAFEGRFWHTKDGGDTWIDESIKGLYIFSFDMTSRQSGYAVALTQASGVALLKYRDSNSSDQSGTGPAAMIVEQIANPAPAVLPNQTHPDNCETIPWAFCCKAGTPCDCTKGIAVPGQCVKDSYLFCCAVGTMCDCSTPP